MACTVSVNYSTVRPYLSDKDKTEVFGVPSNNIIRVGLDSETRGEQLRAGEGGTTRIPQDEKKQTKV